MLQCVRVLRDATISGPAHAADRAWHRQEALPVFAWSRLARGFFSGRISRDDSASTGATLEEHVRRCCVCEDDWRRLEGVEALAVERGLTVPQVALAWVLSQDFPVFALVGSLHPDEAASNTAIVDQPLTPAEVAWLDRR